jgi:membrane fusion protein, multidrug efflux system
MLSNSLGPRSFNGSARVVLFGTIALIATGCRDAPERPEVAARTAATTVAPESIARVTRQRISAGPTISGELRPEREVTLRAEVAGSVADFTVKEGERVRRGQVLCRIDAQALGEARASAQAAVRAAENALETALRQEQRARLLAEEALVAQRDVEAAHKAVADAEAQLAEARARIAAADEQSTKTIVRAPLSGIVSKRAVNTGDVVAPATPLASIIDPSSMQLEALVPSEALPMVRVGARVEFHVAGYPGEVFTGRIDRISPIADAVTRQVRSYVSVPNPSGRLVAGLFAEGRVTAASREGLVVPATAVDMNGSRPRVLRVRDGRVEQVPVEVGLRDDRHARVEIRLGVDEGDTVLDGAAQAIAPGTPVSVEPGLRTAMR